MHVFVHGMVANCNAWMSMIFVFKTKWWLIISRIPINDLLLARARKLLCALFIAFVLIGSCSIRNSGESVIIFVIHGSGCIGFLRYIGLIIVVLSGIGDIST